MKVGFLVNSFSGGGAQRVISTLSKTLENDIEKTLLLVSPYHMQYEFGGEIIQLSPIMNRLPRNRTGTLPLVFYPIAVTSLIYNLKRACKEHEFDLIISFLPLSNFVNAYLAKADTKILSSRNFESINNRSFFGRFSLRSHRTPNKTIAVSEMVKADLIKNFNVNPKQIDVIYNPVDIDWIDQLIDEPVEDEYSFIGSVPTIITVGRLVRTKCQKNLIDSFCNLKKKINSAKLLIIGQGPMELELKEHAARTDYSEDIHFLGFKKNPFKYLAKSTVYVTTSIVEGFSNALLEAMACGVPVVSSDCFSGPRELISPNSTITKQTDKVEYGEYGILFPSSHGENDFSTEQICSMLSNCLIDLISSQTLLKEFSELSRIRALDFKTDIIADRWKNEILS